MNARNLLLTLGAALTLVFATSGCRSSKSVSATGQSATDTAISRDASVEQRYKSLVTSCYREWSTLSVPVKIELSKPKHFSISGRAYMERNKSVLISLRFLGMEVGTIYVDNDSLFITEKIHKYYVAEGVKSLLGGYPLTVADLQSLLIGQPFMAGKGPFTKADRKNLYICDAPVSSTWTITPPPPADGINYTFSFSMSNDRLERLTVTTDDYLPATVVYSDGSPTPAGSVNSVMNIAATAAKTPIAVSLKWNFRNAEWNSPDLRQWKRPKGYTRLKQKDIINMLSSFQP